MATYELRPGAGADGAADDATDVVLAMNADEDRGRDGELLSPPTADGPSWSLRRMLVAAEVVAGAAAGAGGLLSPWGAWIRGNDAADPFPPDRYSRWCSLQYKLPSARA